MASAREILVTSQLSHINDIFLKLDLETFFNSLIKLATTFQLIFCARELGK